MDVFQGHSFKAVAEINNRQGLTLWPSPWSPVLKSQFIQLGLYY